MKKLVKITKHRNIAVINVSPNVEHNNEIFFLQKTFTSAQVNPMKTVVVATCPVHGESMYVLMNNPTSNLLRFKCLSCHIESGSLKNMVDVNQEKERRDTTTLGKLVRSIIGRIKR